MLPEIFMNVRDAWMSPKVQAKRTATKTVKAVKMNNDSRAYFKDGPLKWEFDVYMFARALFNERLRRSNIL